ncbi:hypothetical protein fugu_013384 [Takifugu bimaculatus]|uniref:Uncharacterized protein n=1 Tax=Takifugu bimaculatus TaxID=433685 RepID=A0A4Z2C4Q9_9TELE|nr:hypothetical protein fugu_013384 [Takifugu bimaculatus]
MLQQECSWFKWKMQHAKRKMNARIVFTCVSPDRLDETDFMYIRNRPKHEQNVPSSARQSVMSERSGGTPPYHSSPRPSLSQSHPRLSHYHSYNTLPHEGERLSFSLDDTFRELDEFQEDPPLFLEENSWEREDSEHSDPTLTLLNCTHFQENFLPLYDLQYSFMWVTFCGKTEDELSGLLENIRESAKRMGMHWAHRRACFLLGRLCAKKLKFSQARVYYEEALNVCVDSFSDTPAPRLALHKSHRHLPKATYDGQAAPDS